MLVLLLRVCRLIGTSTEVCWNNRVYKEEIIWNLGQNV